MAGVIIHRHRKAVGFIVTFHPDGKKNHLSKMSISLKVPTASAVLKMEREVVMDYFYPDWRKMKQSDLAIIRPSIDAMLAEMTAERLVDPEFETASA